MMIIMIVQRASNFNMALELGLLKHIRCRDQLASYNGPGPAAAYNNAYF